MIDLLWTDVSAFLVLNCRSLQVKPQFKINADDPRERKTTSAKTIPLLSGAHLWTKQSCFCASLFLPACLWWVGVFGPCAPPPCCRKRAAPLTMKKLSLRLEKGKRGKYIKGWGNLNNRHKKNTYFLKARTPNSTRFTSRATKDLLFLLLLQRRVLERVALKKDTGRMRRLLTG